MIKQLFIIAVLLLYYTGAPAQKHLFNVQHITTDDGLANLLTKAIYKDQKGLLWISTQYGLNRYDGYTFQLFTKENHGLRNNHTIQHISEGEEGKLWLFYSRYIGNGEDEKWEANIDIFDPTTQRAIPFDEYFKNAAPFKAEQWQFSTVSDSQTRIWISTQKGQLFLYQHGSFKKVFEKEGLPIHHLTVDHENYIWFAIDHQVFRINQEGEILQHLDLPNLVVDIWVEEGGKLWLTTVKGVGTNKRMTIWSSINQNYKLEEFKLHRDGILQKKIYNASRSKENYWYVSIDDQMYLFSPNGDHLFDFEKQVKNGPTKFWRMLETDQHIWLTGSEGILKTQIKRNPFHLIHSRDKFSDCRSITEDPNGNIYFLNALPYQWTPKNQTIEKLSNSISNIGLIYSDSTLWIGSYNTDLFSYQLDLRNKKEISYNLSEYSPGVRATFKTSEPNIWLMGLHKGLVYLDLKNKKRLPFDQYNDFEELKTTKINYFHENDSGIWIATEKGIFLMKEGQGIVQHFQKASGDLPFDNIHHLYEDEQGVFWLATKGGGLIEWKLNQPYKIFRQFTTTDGLSHDYLYAVYGDDYDNLWISSDKGLMCMNKNTLGIKTFLIKDGLPHNEFNFTAHYQAKDGTLYFGGLGGLISFHPKIFANESSNPSPLKFVDCHLLEDGKDKMTNKISLLNRSKEILIRPQDKLLELQVALLDYHNSEQHLYAYKIEGYSDYWNNIDENLIRITHLPYGYYTLKVKGQNKRFGWSTNELSLGIQVLKPFYSRWWFQSSLGILLLALINWIWQRRNKEQKKRQERLEEEVKKRTQTIRKQAEELKELDIAKTHFFSNVTHEFRTPLTLVIGPLEQIIKEQLPATVYKKRLGGILKNAQHLLGLINQMLDLSKIESGRMDIALTRGNIIHYTQELTKRFQPLAQKKGQRLIFIAPQKNWETHFDKDKWDKIIYNLLSNALKFTSAGEVIQLSLKNIKKDKKEFIRLDVKDTGRGIEENQLQQIFNRFYQTDSSNTRMQEGTGIGLALVKELVELQGGEIKVASKRDKGTSFEICLPIPSSNEVKSLINDSIIVPESINFISEKISTFSPPLTSKKNKLEILIIEDNEEMREYIRYCIDPAKYNIKEAEDGEIGIQMAIKLIPDLIISDVMMPKKDGFEVTQTIRKNIATSHIPMILLTAKASLKSRLEGLQSGADAYLTKPFSPQELALRIQKLIEVRRLLQQRYNKGTLDGKIVKNQAFEKEDEFIAKLRSYILQNIDEPSLNGDFIGKYFNISRVHLYRKLKALTDLSISEFVKNIRLKKAMELIQEGELNISEISYQTGFSSISHFSRSFKKQYGKAPSELWQKVK